MNIYARKTVSAAAIVLGSSGTSAIVANPGQSKSGSITSNTGGMSSTQASVVYHTLVRYPTDTSVEAKSLARVYCV